MEYMRDGSTPRRNSPVRAQFEVENVRTSVPFHECQFRSSVTSKGARSTVSLAVARVSPSELNAIAFRGVPCAGIILTFPVSISTI